MFAEGIAVSLRVYTLCAVSITASAVAGLLVGGFIALGSRNPATQPVSSISAEIAETGVDGPGGP